MRGDLGQRRQAARVAFDRDDMLGAFRQQRARQAAGPGPDLDDGRAVERTRRAGDAAGEIEIEEEILAQRLAGVETMRGDDLAQRRQIAGRSVTGPPWPGRRASPRRQPQRRDEARRIGDSLAGDVEGRAMIGRGAHEGQAQRDVDGAARRRAS